MKIPKLYPTKEISVNGHIIELGAYKAEDQPLINKIEDVQLELPNLLLGVRKFEQLSQKLQEMIGADDISEEDLLEKIEHLKDTDFSPEKVEELQKIKSKLNTTTEKLVQYHHVLAQRGLKRHFYGEQLTEKICSNTHTRTKHHTKKGIKPTITTRQRNRPLFSSRSLTKS